MTSSSSRADHSRSASVSSSHSAPSTQSSHTPIIRDPNNTPTQTDYWNRSQITQQILPNHSLASLPNIEAPLPSLLSNSMNEVKPLDWSSFNTIAAANKYMSSHNVPVYNQMSYPSYQAENQNWMKQDHHNAVPPGYPSGMAEGQSPSMTILEPSPQPIVKIEPNYNSSPHPNHQPAYSPSPLQHASAIMHPTPRRQTSRQAVPLDQNTSIAMYNNYIDTKQQGTHVL